MRTAPATEPAVRPVAPPRRVELGLAGLVVLGEALAVSGGPVLPPDLVVDPVARGLAGPAADAVLEQARAALVAHGVLDDAGPVATVAANVAALTASPRRLRTSLIGAGPHGSGTSLVAHHWTDAEAAGSIVRDGSRVTLSLFDPRGLGDELRDLLPEPEQQQPDRSRLVAPLEALRTVSALPPRGADGADGADEDASEAVMAALLGIDVHLATAVREWSEGVRAVLHLSVLPADPARLPGMLVWLLDRRGWWSTRTWTDRAADPVTRMVELAPVTRDDLGAALGVLTTRTWL